MESFPDLMGWFRGSEVACRLLDGSQQAERRESNCH